MIDKRRMPPASLFLTIGIIAVGTLGVAQVLCPYVASRVEFLSETDDDRVANRQHWKSELQPTRHVLSHIDDDFAVLAGDALRLQLLQHLHILSHGSTQGSVGNSRALSFLPFGIVKAHRCPTVKLLTGVVDLTIVFVVRTDGTIQTNLPFLVSTDGLATAVRKLHDEVGTQRRIAEVRYLIRLFILLHGVVTAIAQHHTNGIFLRQQARHVESIIEHRPTIVCRGRSQHLLPYPLAVDEGLVHAQATDVECGLSHFLVEIKLLTQIAG